MKIIDLSHTIDEKTITYKGLPAPIICDFWEREASKINYSDGSSFQIGKIELISNTGTYIDCPFHRYEDGEDIADVSIERMANLDAHIVHWDYKNQGLAVLKSAFLNFDVKGKAILIHTGWSENWNTEEYYSNHPYLHEDAAEYLKVSGAILVGIDSYNIDDTRTDKRPVHSTLLKDGILIVEHLTNLGLISDESFRFTAAPPKIKGMGTFPVRAFAIV
ncbi:cyclase family protein [Marinigracilibium pacificum]|uniref:Cyclase family protein n=1 Tax=Marinigracilibium pacificum TaxID=2729599 RepID=A0A848IYY9_9BACT|nr:cyclase family protein [Marinigracilibium pacificum]NMM48495.1 cyclase family protein [Marinigracilibium pacificum]